MNTSIDREKLTAYVLGELDAAERPVVEAALAADEALRALAEELRTAALWTQDVFAQEPSLSLEAEQRVRVQQQAERAATENVVPMQRKFWPVALKWAAAAMVVALPALVVYSQLAKPQSSGKEKGELLLAEGPKDKEVVMLAPPSANREKLEEAKPAVPQQAVTDQPALSPPVSAKAKAAKPEAAPATAAAPTPQSLYGISSAAPAPSMGEQETRLGVRADFYGQVEGAVRRSVAPQEGKPDAASQVQLESLGYIRGPQSPPPPNPYNDPSKNYWPGHNTEAYAPIVENPFLAVTQNPLSTFSIDVDTASYSNLRRFLEQGSVPPPDSVRIEELVNYFTYNYEPPKDKETPFAARVAIADCPWKTEHRLARIGIKGWEMPAQERPASNLVFLLDVSGSMQPENKLPLVKKSMQMLANKLDERDRVAIVVYASSSGMVLPSTPGDQKGAILEAIGRLEAGGSTQGSAGIKLAYETAVGNFIKGGVNRVILCTDGDFNVGVTNEGDLTRIIEGNAKSGVFLSVLGFGMGNLKDSMMEKLADKGNGNYAYIDTENEARKVLVDQMQGTLVTIAKDVKIQMEFNPALVSAYRLIGYENRMLRAEDFNDDKKDAGEIGAGHTVTALYEIVPAGQSVPTPAVDALKYQQTPVAAPVPPSTSGEMFTLKIRYKKPDGDVSTKLEFPIRDEGMKYAQADPDFKFAAAVAAFGMILRGSENKGNANLSAVQELAQEGRGNDPNDYRLEFIRLVAKAAALQPSPPPLPLPKLIE